jgi:uncharacterized protein YnzC (UPF0291/DUF896 family)
MSVVKEEKVERSAFRKKLNEAKAAGMKERLESIAYLDDDGNDISPSLATLNDDDIREREVNNDDDNDDHDDGEREVEGSS